MTFALPQINAQRSRNRLSSSSTTALSPYYHLCRVHVFPAPLPSRISGPWALGTFLKLPISISDSAVITLEWIYLSTSPPRTLTLLTLLLSFTHLFSNLLLHSIVGSFHIFNSRKSQIETTLESIQQFLPWRASPPFTLLERERERDKKRKSMCFGEHGLQLPVLGKNGDKHILEQKHTSHWLLVFSKSHRWYIKRTFELKSKPQVPDASNLAFTSAKGWCQDKTYDDVITKTKILNQIFSIFMLLKHSFGRITI